MFIQKKEMTSRERYMAIYENREVDRPAFRLWGFEPGMGLLHPAYEPVCKLAGELTDVITGGGSAFSFYGGIHAAENVTWTREKTDDPKWDIVKTVFHTKRGDLVQRDMVSTCGEPGYIMEYAAKEPEDLIAIIDMPYEPYDFSSDSFYNAEKRVGDRGFAMFSLPHAGYAVQILTGSENLAYFSVDDREAVDYAISTYTDRVVEHVKRAVENGVKGVYGWCGPELLTPPLLNKQDFRDFCVKYDKKVIDVIKNAGNYFWVHCHGKVADLLDDFIYMGVDVLNPLEPPKNGDVDLEKIVEKYGNRIGLVGNVEIQDIIQAEPEVLLSLTEQCVAAGKKSGRFILCPSAGFMEYVRPEERYINNLLLFLKEGYRLINE